MLASAFVAPLSAAAPGSARLCMDAAVRDALTTLRRTLAGVTVLGGPTASNTVDHAALREALGKMRDDLMNYHQALGLADDQPQRPHRYLELIRVHLVWRAKRQRDGVGRLIAWASDEGAVAELLCTVRAASLALAADVENLARDLCAICDVGA